LGRVLFLDAKYLGQRVVDAAAVPATGPVLAALPDRVEPQMDDLAGLLDPGRWNGTGRLGRRAGLLVAADEVLAAIAAPEGQGCKFAAVGSVRVGLAPIG